MTRSWAGIESHIGPSALRGGLMAEELDTSQGWCCDGRTWKEHADEAGHCCQSEGTQIEGLPADGREKARERLSEAG
jgi:hypothetical protein